MFVVSRDQICCLFYKIRGISHGHRQSRAPQHRPVVIAVSQGHDLGISDAQHCPQILQRPPFVRLYMRDFQVSPEREKDCQDPLPFASADFFNPGKRGIPCLLRGKHQRDILHMRGRILQQFIKSGNDLSASVNVSQDGRSNSEPRFQHQLGPCIMISDTPDKYFPDHILARRSLQNPADDLVGHMGLPKHGPGCLSVHCSGQDQ